jgi:hypothetical protein
MQRYYINGTKVRRNVKDGEKVMTNMNWRTMGTAYTDQTEDEESLHSRHGIAYEWVVTGPWM